MKKNHSAIQTEYLKSCILESVFNQLEVKAIDQISITDIASNAGVSRMTIYRYYDSKEDIIRKYVKESYEAYIKEAGSLNLDAIALAPYFFDYFRRNSDKIELLIRRNLFHLVSENFVDYVKRYTNLVNNKPNLSEMHLSYFYAYTASGMLSMVKTWIESGMKESNDEMSEILMKVKLEQAKFST